LTTKTEDADRTDIAVNMMEVLFGFIIVNCCVTGSKNLLLGASKGANMNAFDMASLYFYRCSLLSVPCKSFKLTALPIGVGHQKINQAWKYYCSMNENVTEQNSDDIDSCDTFQT
jgi:hypothetical protein